MGDYPSQPNWGERWHSWRRCKACLNWLPKYKRAYCDSYCRNRALREERQKARETKAAAEAAKQRRSVDMPTEDDALRTMFTAWQRLKELGWREIMYCPKDGVRFLSVEAGSTGQHVTWYDGQWPTGSWWVESGGDTWPAHPIMWKPMPIEAKDG